MELERDGVAARHDYSADAEQVRTMLAEMMGCDAAEIAFTRNATDGINLVLSGLQWKPGDVIITTDQEHEAVQHPLLHLQARAGVAVCRVACSPYPEEMAARLDAAWSPAVRLVAFSHVTCETGTRLPADAICRWARARNCLSLVDTAQSLGTIPVSAPEIGCDYLAGNGHKWLHGPKGTGFLYASAEHMAELSPCHIGAGSFEAASIETGEARLWESGKRFEFGTRSFALMSGWKESLVWMQQTGLDAVFGHIAAMAQMLRSELAKTDGVTVLTPDCPQNAAGLVSFMVAGIDAGELVSRLSSEFSVYTRYVQRQNAARVSAAHFACDEDVVTLLGAIHRCASGRR
jgi:selenocysteine lyase/cysteine desulfurase